MTEHDEHLPASKIVEQFGDEIRAAIAAVADETPTLAKDAAKVEARRSAVRWYMVTVILSLIVSIAVSWLMLSYAPRWHASDVTYQHSGSVETCVRGENAPAAHPEFICHPVTR